LDPNDGKTPLVQNKFMQDFMSGFNQRVANALLVDEHLTEANLLSLGKKDPEKEVEAFITANTVELAKDKWLCPLSGKKFKGPEFVRKHLQSKHQEKLDQVKIEVDYFNNFLADPKRPQNVEVKGAIGTGGSGGGSSQTSHQHSDDRRSDYDRGGYGNRPSGGWSGGGDRGPPRSYGGGMRNYGGGGYGGGDRGGGGYGGGDRGGGYSGPPRRMWEAGGSSRPQVSYKDLDAPEDIY